LPSLPDGHLVSLPGEMPTLPQRPFDLHLHPRVGETTSLLVLRQAMLPKRNRQPKPPVLF
jgi:hypothetical protein